MTPVEKRILRLASVTVAQEQARCGGGTSTSSAARGRWGDAVFDLASTLVLLEEEVTDALKISGGHGHHLQKGLSSRSPHPSATGCVEGEGGVVLDVVVRGLGLGSDVTEDHLPLVGAVLIVLTILAFVAEIEDHTELVGAQFFRGLRVVEDWQ